MKFDEFEAEDLLLEESFRNYCLGINDTDIQFWEGWILANPARKPVVQQARELYFLLNGHITPGQIKEDRAIFHTKLQQHIQPKKRTRIGLYAGAVAASLILFVILFMPFQKETLPYEAKAGERKQLDLPDGSKVRLNAGSVLKLAGDREMNLEGEAFFEVAHDPARPFIVHTPAMDIQVLGTVFNVKAYANDSTTETLLLKGSVEVTLHNTGREKIVLRPGEKIVFTKASTRRILQANYHAADSSVAEVSWTQNKLDFTNEPLAAIAPTLERWYNVKVTIEDSTVAGYRYTGVFDNKSIDQVLKALQLSRPFNYTIDSTIIRIRK